MNDSTTISRLRELIAVLDRRHVQVHRPGEAVISKDAAAMKTKALERLAELERRPIAASR